MLEMVKAATKSIGPVAGLFMDELACVFDGKNENLHKDLIEWISDQMANDFQDEFVVDLTKDDVDGRVIDDKFPPVKLAFSIDDPATDFSNIGVNLGPMVSKGNSSLAARLIPHFR